MKNRLLYTPIIIISVIVVLMMLSHLESTTILGIKLKQINILSDILPNFGVEAEGQATEAEPMLLASFEDRGELSAAIAADTLGAIDAATEDKPIGQTVDKDIYDYSKGGEMKTAFLSSLAEAEQRPVRIAVMGDSFIEGDLLTMDIRDMFQTNYSGSGVGFVPITSPTARYRMSVEHEFSDDWTRKDIVNAPKFGDYLLSGFIFLPEEESWVEYKTRGLNKYSSLTSRAELVFINNKAAEIEVVVNERDTMVFRPEASDKLQTIEINKAIKQIHYTFRNVEGLSVYGALLDGAEAGISVDNYAIRGNNGLNMPYVSQKLNQQYSDIRKYDLIILEYGLNILFEENEDKSYKGYDKRFVRLINSIQKSCPGVPILLLGVSERSSMRNGQPVLFDGVEMLNKHQHTAAQECQVMYWNTLSVMQSLGGMKEFVEKGWATKDYTHITSGGGKVIARELYDALTVEPATQVTEPITSGALSSI